MTLNDRVKVLEEKLGITSPETAYAFVWDDEDYPKFVMCARENGGDLRHIYDNSVDIPVELGKTILALDPRIEDAATDIDI